jgi:hypothetical protein
LLFSAGLDVATATFSTDDAHARMLRRVDHWIMEGIHAES